MISRHCGLLLKVRAPRLSFPKQGPGYDAHIANARLALGVDHAGVILRRLDTTTRAGARRGSRCAGTAIFPDPPDFCTGRSARPMAQSGLAANSSRSIGA